MDAQGTSGPPLASPKPYLVAVLLGFRVQGFFKVQGLGFGV